jgi:hypothetical protein
MEHIPLWYLLCGIFVIACGFTFMARGFAGMLAEQIKK